MFLLRTSPRGRRSFVTRELKARKLIGAGVFPARGVPLVGPCFGHAAAAVVRVRVSLAALAPTLLRVAGLCPMPLAAPLSLPGCPLWLRDCRSSVVPR